MATDWAIVSFTDCLSSVESSSVFPAIPDNPKRGRTMTRSSEIVAWHDGWLCVKYTDTDFFKPIRYHIYWPVKQCPKSDADYLIGREAGSSGGSGRYSARTADY